MAKMTFKVVERKNIVQSLIYDWKISISKANEDAAQDVVGYMKDSFLEPKTGIIYPSGHQASAPGEAPAYEYGDLFDSFRIRKLNQYAYGISSSDPAAELLEYGGVYIAPRPYARPALEKVAEELKGSIVKILNRPG